MRYSCANSTANHILHMSLRTKRRYLGKKVLTYFGLGKLVRLKDGGYAVKVKLICSHEGCKRYYFAYLRPGPGGPDHYVYNFQGKYLADLRDQCFACPDHYRACDDSTRSEV